MKIENINGAIKVADYTERLEPNGWEPGSELAAVIRTLNSRQVDGKALDRQFVLENKLLGRKFHRAMRPWREARISKRLEEASR